MLHDNNFQTVCILQLFFALADLASAMNGAMGLCVHGIPKQRIHVYLIFLRATFWLLEPVTQVLKKLFDHLDLMLVCSAELASQAICHTMVPLMTTVPQPEERLYDDTLVLLCHFLNVANVTYLLFVPQLTPFAACHS